MIKKLLDKLGKARTDPGQSLVEIAIIAPLLIFMLIGVFEVGWALRGYLILVNVNREITRFAVRPGYMDFSTKAKINDSFLQVRDWVDTSLGDQLNLDFDGSDANATLIVSHMVVNTGLPCEDMDTCNCSQVTNENYAFTLDDFFIHPAMPGQEHQTKTYGPTSTSTGPRVTRMNYEHEITSTLKPQNNRLNCEVIKKGGVASDNNIMITELFLDQPQLFGFPFISNPLTDPVPLYTRTSMRLVGASRGNLTQNINTIGPVCFAYPFTVNESVLPTLQPGVSTFDILGGPGGGDWGFLAWAPQEPNAVFLENALRFPQLSITRYNNTVVASDKTLSVGDWVRSSDGLDTRVKDEIEALIGQEIVIPVHSQMQQVTNAFPPPINVDAYKITKFIRVRINAGGVDELSSGPDKRVWATYIGLETESCQ